jgi:hypothetical protein
MTTLHQLNIRYVPLEDRLLLRISGKDGAEYRFWLTRRYTALLRQALNREIDRCGGRPILAASGETTKMFKEGAFEKPFEEESTRYPLGESGVLGARIGVNRQQNGNLRLDLAPQQGQGIALNLNRPLLFMFDTLLSQGIAQTGWNLASDEASGSTRVH